MKRPAKAAIAAALAAAQPAFGWVLTITPGPRALYLQVGAGTNNGNNAQVNLVSVSVPAAQVGNGIAQPMTSDSTVAQSFHNNFAVCNPPQQVYIGAWFRKPGNGDGSVAVLSVTTPATLTSGADAIPFTGIRWTSTANGNPAADIPSGTFTGGAQVLRNVGANTWVENCLSFEYANTQLPPAGVYQGRARYTLSAP